MNASKCYVIGDVHGCINTLNELLFSVIKIQKTDSIYFLGDLIDRGPNSKAVFDLIFELRHHGLTVESVMGNHEAVYLSCLQVNNFEIWKKNGSASTLKSFGIKKGNELPKKYNDFIASMPYYIELPKFVLTHAGMNFDIDNPFSDNEAMLWTRSDYVDLEKTAGKKLICGHTPRKLEAIKSSLSQNKIQLDGGCVYYKSVANRGYLCAYETNSRQLFYTLNSEK